MRHLKTKIHWFILIIGFFVTGWSSLYISHLIEKQAEDAFRLKMQDLEAAIVSRLARYEDILFGVAGMFRETTKNVTPEQFDAYADTLSMKERLPALDTINFAQYVPKSEKENFVRHYKDDTEGRGRDPVLADRDEYMVITRVYPASLSYALGVDVLAATGIRVAIADGGDEKKTPQGGSYSHNKAYSSGLPIRTRGKKGEFLAARLGIYKGEKLIGTSGIGFEISTFFKEAVPKKLANTLHYVMWSTGRDNGARFAKPVLVFDSKEIGANFDKQDDLLRGQFDVRFGGVVFKVEATSKKETQEYKRYLPSAVLVIGILFFTGIGLSCKRILSDNVALKAAVNAIKNHTIELQSEISRTKALERKLAAVIDSERTRIGRELHDDLGQRLTAISVSAEILSAKLLPVDLKLAAQADDLGRATSETMMQIRTLVQGLMPVASDKDGLRDALTDLIAEISRLSGLNCTFDFDDPVKVADENVSTHLYRIAQEALNNAIRHAHASSIEVRLDEIDGKVSLSIADDGCGFDQARSTGGFGLSTIAHRASVIGYNLQIVSSLGKGTMIKVTEY